MNGLRVNHYGLSTDNLVLSIETLRLLGYCVGEITLDPVQKVLLVFDFQPQEAMGIPAKEFEIKTPYN